MQSCRKGNCRGIRASSSQSCIIIIFINPLESGYHNDLTAVQLSSDTLCINSFQSGIAIYACGMHSYLKSIQGYRRNAQAVHCHAHKSYRHLFSDSKKHIHFSLWRLFTDILRHGDQLICVLSHCRKHHYYIISIFIILDTPAGNIKNTFFICHRGASEFFYN